MGNNKSLHICFICAKKAFQKLKEKLDLLMQIQSFLKNKVVGDIHENLKLCLSKAPSLKHLAENTGIGKT